VGSSIAGRWGVRVGAKPFLEQLHCPLYPFLVANESGVSPLILDESG